MVDKLHKLAFNLYSEAEYKDAEVMISMEADLIESASNKAKWKKEKTLDNIILMALIQKESAKYDKALELFDKSLEIAMAISNVEKQAEISLNIGHVFVKLAKFTEAEETYKKALDIYKGLPRDDNIRLKIAETLNTLGVVAKKLNQYDKATQVSICSLVHSYESFTMRR